jgi:hypothetical protein
LAGTVWLALRGGRAWFLALVVLLLATAGARAQNVFPAQAVGTLSGEQSVTVTAQVQGVVATVQVLTLGMPNLDFAAGVSQSCVSTQIAVGGTCTQSVTFTPANPGLRVGAVVLLDSAGHVLGTAYISGTGLGGLGVLASGNVIPVAGQYRTWQSTQDGILATTANLRQPSSVTLDGAGNMYIADSAHNRIRKVAAPVSPAVTGNISPYAGIGDSGYAGDGAAAVSATLTTPGGVALDGAGNLYIADTGNNVVRKVTKATGIISTVAGNGTGGFAGDGAAAVSAELNQPWGVTVDSSGNLYIADTANQCIRRVDAGTGIITTVAGNGVSSGVGDGKGTFSGDGGQATLAGLSLPYAVAFDASGNLFIPDSANNRIRRVALTGIISTVAGTGSAGWKGDGFAATAAFLNNPSGVALDPAGNIYIADTQNAAIRKVNSSASSTPGIISTIVMNATGTALGADGTTLGVVNLFAPIGLFMDGSGNLYMADYYDMFILELKSNQAILNFTGTTVRQGDKSTPKSQIVENDGNAPLDLTAITAGTNSALDASTNCPIDNPLLAISGDCTIGAVFAPTVAGSPLAGDITVGKAGDTINSPLDIRLIGNATLVNSTTVAVKSSVNPSNFGQSVTFTATVTTGASTGNLTGTVSFFDGTKTLASKIALNAPGTTATASFAITTLAVGSHTITASYSGDSTHFAATSTDDSALPLTQIVQEATATNLVSSLNPSPLGQSVTFTATVTPPNGGGVVPDGSIIFYDGTTILGSATLNASGVATLQTAALTTGLHSITAVYGGDATIPILGSTSAVLKQDVQASSSITVMSSGSPSTYGASVIFTATVTPNGTVAATGAVNFLDGAIRIGTGTLTAAGQATFTTSSLAVGSHTITAAYPGDTNYSGTTSAAITQTVNQAQTSTAVAALPNPGIAGKAVAITATVQVIAGAATTTGKVTFTDSGVALGTATLSGTGAATATISPILTPGSHSIVATYLGDVNDQGSTGTLVLAVIQATTQTAVTATPTSAQVLAPVTITAKVTGNGGMPSGSVTFSANGTRIGSAAALDATGTATITYSGLAAGSYAITAVYSGDTNDQGSTGTAAIQLVVGTIPTATDLGISSTSGTDPQVILVATVLNAPSAIGGATLPMPTGTVTFTSGSTVVGQSTVDSGGIATLIPALPSGTYSIVATYSGDAQHSKSTSSAVQMSTTATGFNLTVTPASVTMVVKQNATVTVALTSISGFTDNIGLGCSSLPAGVTCHFATISAPLAANGAQSVQLTIDTNNPLSGGSSAMNAHTGNPGVSLAGLLLPFSLIFGWTLWRFRKRNATLLSMVLILLLSGAAMLATGCSGMSSSSAAPGTYVIQVTGTGVNSNVIHYQNVTLNITK